MSAYKKISNILFKVEPENIHNFTESILQALGSINFVQEILVKNFCYTHEMLKNEICGLNFYNPIGLAAGFDKNATMIKGLSCLGFGFLEIGTVTKNSQKGNPKPRLFRFKEEQSIQNAMGFNNDGAEKISSRIAKLHPYILPIGINLGKNKNISTENALKNYEDVLKEFLDVGDYYVFNLSSPNTPNLRDLQNINFVQELFLMAKSYTKKPIFLKISPDMEVDTMLEVCDMAISKGADGIIATNTTIDYSLLSSPKSIGGISGNALTLKSRAVFEELSKAFFKKTTLISVGGIDDAQEAYRRIKMGASLVQVYSGFVFKGPSLCKSINSEIQEYLLQDGFMSIKDAIGVDLK